MVETILGTRIRESRRQAGITQVELARRIGISASYLNLIERNKRRIAGELLRRTADELGLSVDQISGTADRRLSETMTEIAHLPMLDELDIDAKSAPSMIAQFPGWAQAIAVLARSEREANQRARVLSDRMTHDPFLGETVHRMLSRVASIRSAAEILTEYSDVSEDQRGRFHRIIRGEAEALTDIGEALAAYFARTDETDAKLTPVDEIEALFEARDNHFAELEENDAGAPAIEAILSAAPQIETDAARHRAIDWLGEYAAAARALPMAEFAEQAAALGYDLEALTGHFGTDADVICRRLAALPPGDGVPRFGYFRANAAGSIIEMLGLPGLVLPRYAAACPLWVLFRAQQVPGSAMRQLAEFPSGARFVFVARARQTGGGGFGRPRHYLTDMLAMRETDAALTVYATGQEMPPEDVGPSCRICPRTACPHRVADPFAG